jgi:superfamily II DNA or RNA helicase
VAKDYSRVATLDALTKPEGKGGRATVIVPNDALRAEVAEAYRARIAQLKKHAFWGLGEAEYRPDRGLRWPQRRAVAFVQAFLAARGVSGACAADEAALIKMPTGTGKSGVIAALACASPGIKRTLVLTPRTSLVRQMAGDLTTRFWKKLGAQYTRNGLIEGLEEDALDALRAEPKDIKDRPVRRLVAEQYQLIKDDENNERQIWVGTFNALHLLLGVKPPAHRSFQGREERAPGAAFGSGKDGVDGLNLEEFRELIKSVDLVIVDEGHHEPAYSWAQAVRELGKPTVIFTATPYRNDYKYFQVSGKFIFNLPWTEAVDERLIREVVIAESPDSYGRGGVAEADYSPTLFARDFKAAFDGLPPGKKAIVHAKTFGDLKRIQRALYKATGEVGVLIHDRVTGAKKDTPKDPDDGPAREKKILNDLSFSHVHLALENKQAMAARVWLHQYKLLEGVDISEFIEIWLFDDFGSARQLVQQVGRAIRLPDPENAQERIATIRAARKRLTKFEGAPTIAQRTLERWNGYKAFERYAEAKPDVAFTAETQLLETLKNASPDVQYVAREFREGRLFSEPPTMSGFMVPCRATVCRVRDTELAEDITATHLDDLAKAAREAMMLEDRFDIVAVASGGEPEHDDVRLIRYLAWRNSPLLIAHQIPEWTMGVLAIVRAGRYIFLLDTEGNCLDLSRLKLVAPEPIELKRLFAEHVRDNKQNVRIVETTAKGLDVSELGLRSISVRRHALDASYFDLAEASQTPTTIVGYSPFAGSTARRRLSLARSNLTDATNQFVSLKLYVDWARKVASVMSDETVRPHGYFERFAKEVPPLDSTLGEPKSILLDLADLFPEPGSPKDRGWKRSEIEKVLEEDTCCAVIAVANANGDVDHHFMFANVQVDIRYEYHPGVPSRGRYVLTSEALNEKLVDEVETTDEGADDELSSGAFGQRLSPSLTRLLNVEQAFEVVPASSGVVYSHGHFYKPDVDIGLLSVLEGDAAVVGVVSEKGDTRVDDPDDWHAKTLFGKVETWASGAQDADGLAGDLARSSILICDDSSIETADFFAIIDEEREKRILIIHAKAADTTSPSASAGRLQDVARQAQASLALAGSARSAVPPLEAWEKTWSVHLGATSTDQPDANGKRPAKKVDRGHEISRSRLWKSQSGGIVEARERLLAALADPTFTREVVILTVGLLSQSAADQAFKNRSVPDDQFIYFLASVRTSFDRAGVRLRVVCNP